MYNVILYLAAGFLVGIGVAFALGKVSFLQALFSDSGAASFGRIAAAIALCASIFWVTLIVQKTNTLPDFSGITFFIGFLYGISKVGEAVKSFAPKKEKDDETTS